MKIKKKTKILPRFRIACIKALLAALVLNSILLAAAHFMPSDYLTSWLKADILFSLTIRPPETYSDPLPSVTAPFSPPGSGGGYREPLPWPWSASSSRNVEETSLKESASTSEEEVDPFRPAAERTAEAEEQPAIFPVAPFVVNPAPASLPPPSQSVGFPSAPSPQTTSGPTAPPSAPSLFRIEKTENQEEGAPTFSVTVERQKDSFFKELLIKVQVVLMAGLFVISASLLLI